MRFEIKMYYENLFMKVKVHSSQFNDVMYVVMSSQSLRNKNVMLVIFDISETV